MKIVKNQEWKFLGFQPIGTNHGLVDGGFVFQHKKGGDFMVIKKAKLILRNLRLVLYLGIASCGDPSISLGYSSAANFSDEAVIQKLIRDENPEEKVLILKTLANSDMNEDDECVDVDSKLTI